MPCSVTSTAPGWSQTWQIQGIIGEFCTTSGENSEQQNIVTK